MAIFDKLNIDRMYRLQKMYKKENGVNATEKDIISIMLSEGYKKITKEYNDKTKKNFEDVYEVGSGTIYGSSKYEDRFPKGAPEIDVDIKKDGIKHDLEFYKPYLKVSSNSINNAIKEVFKFDSKLSREESKNRLNELLRSKKISQSIHDELLTKI